MRVEEKEEGRGGKRDGKEEKSEDSKGEECKEREG